MVVLIMAGGAGTRFWPASTKKYPKQFLKLIGDRTMLQKTVDRILPLIDYNHIFICTLAEYKSICIEQVPDIPESNIIIEPFSKNSAPCILLSSLYIMNIYGKDVNIVVIPSDQLVSNEQEFLSVLSDANQFIHNNGEIILTIGIRPNRPETGYGYINYSSFKSYVNNHEIRNVNSFVEKPDLKKAMAYVEDGSFLWNAGIFVFNCEHIIEEFKKYSPKIYAALSDLPDVGDVYYSTRLAEKYRYCDSISIDYAIMEKTEGLCVIPGDFGWDDVGSWLALKRYLAKDVDNNYIKGQVKVFGANNYLVFSGSKEILLLDVSNIFLIETGEKIIVGKMDSLSKVHELRDK